MSLKALTWAFSLRGMKASERLLLLALANHASDEGECYPSTGTLAEETDLCRNTLFRGLKSLEAQGLIVRSKHFRNGNGYQLSMADVSKVRRIKSETSQNQDVSDLVPESYQICDVSSIKNETTLIKNRHRTVNEPSVEAFPVSTESKQATEAEPQQLVQEPEPKAKPRKRAELVSFPQALPDEWAKSAKEARPDINPAFVFGKLKARYAGTVTKKAMHTWRREYMNWVGREFARGQSTNNQRASSWVRKDQKDMDYSEESVLHFLGVA